MSSRRRARRQASPRRAAPLPTQPAEVLQPPLVAPTEVEPEPTYPRRLTTEELTGGKDDTQLTADLAAALRRLPACNHCGGRHTRACPRVREMQFHPNGALAAVKFWPEGKWNDSEIIWQEDLIDED